MRGTFCLVLHSHLPWVAHHGRWPVGEEWLHQAWAQSYLRLAAMLRELAAEGGRDVLTLGVTPVLAAQLDDPHCLSATHAWLGGWQQRAHEAAPRLPAQAAHEHRLAAAALHEFEAHWRHGASPVLRGLPVELLGGPATHPFGPLLDPRVRDFGLRLGLRDAVWRTGSRPAGIWAPECGYRPGMEAEYAAAGVSHFLVDGPALHGETAFARPVGDVLCVGRDLEVTYRVWSPRKGYPGHRDYRDFHTYDHATGLKPARVTGPDVPPHEKASYEPDRAAARVAEHAADFTACVGARLDALRERHGRPALSVAAFDTELFGHWWHEGPAWLAAVLRALPEAGIRVTTLRGALADPGLVGEPVELPESSWGSGKDWRVWAGEPVADLVALNAEVQERLLTTVDKARSVVRDPLLDALASQALLALSSDWAFMVSTGSTVDYARDRARRHADRVSALAALLDEGRRAEAATLTATWEPSPFGHLDARDL
ncbi:1,4-alpha-glucan branching protein domain-containing protein [Pseudonocardia xishanensis]|uniref:Glycoside hydrolase family 57 protein n=1 Tax=Pseudonocardia xishanensis TaxID=630995 RepID=A0ABP8RJC0_9PSEU